MRAELRQIQSTASLYCQYTFSLVSTPVWHSQNNEAASTWVSFWIHVTVLVCVQVTIIYSFLQLIINSFLSCFIIYYYPHYFVCFPVYICTFLCMLCLYVVMWSQLCPISSSIYHFSSSVEEVGVSEPSGHSWKTERHTRVIQKQLYIQHIKVIFMWHRELCAQLTFTLSSSGLPGSDFCEGKACKVRQDSHIISDEHVRWNSINVRLLLTFFVCCISSVDLDLFFMCLCGEVVVGH